MFNSDYYGDVHETSTATQIFNQAVSQGQNAGLVQHQKDPLKVLKLKILFYLKFVWKKNKKNFTKVDLQII